ncbi:DUF4097 family beta strand repeat-containing protein [Treponema phagedenis]|uniref:DUF4097 family beta strand repeat-containing protein n=1 Tax=Treponema phagedenis TaxID=162 RepID=UPI0001F63DC2|nr:DUF4097 family beta strand repeat-containing protein [Treponema phagedenis]EFW38379.1 hypothetical protein HMPREF9554_01095 [Treponema phagedenis F0421]TYT78500.1 DUF4097 domain-containing protein [Treponema phagedenis]
MGKKIFKALFIILLGIAFIAGGYLLGGRLKHNTWGSPFLGKIFGSSQRKIINHKQLRNTADFPVDGSGFTVIDKPEIKNLDINLSYANIIIKGNDHNGITYQVTNDEKIKVRVGLEGDTLTIDDSMNKRTWNFFRFIGVDAKEPYPELTVYVPYSILYDSISIRQGVGSCVLQGLSTYSLHLKTGVGEAEVTGITASKTIIETGVGESNFTRCDFTDMYLSSGVGETTFSGKLSGNSEIKSGIGEVHFEIEAKKESYSISTSQGIGEIYVDSQRVGKTLGTQYSQSSIQDENNTLKIENGIGSVYLKFTE